MKTPLWKSTLGFLLIALIFSVLSCGCAGDDDDESDDSPSQDDDDNDSTDDDDSSDDDTGDDDDDASDDDDDDDDSVDYSKEPLAVMECDLRCADIDEDVQFSGSNSKDPNNSSLTYLIDFGDGQSASTHTATHAYDTPGTYRAVLTVTNELGLSDRSHCDISVGDFPTGTGSMDVVDFQPNFYDHDIREQGNPPDDGGAFFAFFNSPIDAQIDTILINGLPGDPYSGNVEWCEVVDPELSVGELGILRCHSYSDEFNAGEPISIELKDDGTTVWNIDTTLSAPILTLSYITGNVAGDEILVHARNDGDAPYTVTGLSIDGLDVSDFITIDNPDLNPGETAIIHVLQCDGYETGTWMVFTVTGANAKGIVNSSRPIRLFDPVFPHGGGGWNSDDFIENPAALSTYLSRGINAFMFSSFNEHDPETVFGLAETNGFYIWAHTDDPDQSVLDMLAIYGDHSALLGNATSGEPDIGGALPIEELDEVIYNRTVWGNKPLWIYNACMMQFPSFAAIPDIAGMDHYCVKRPKCNSLMFPPFNWDYVERAGQYQHAIKKNAEPRPTWSWTQGPNTGWDGFWASSDEIRSQWYQVLSRGAKGMLWFQYKTSYESAAPAGSLQEVQTLEEELFQMEEYLLEGDVATFETVVFSESENLDITVTVSPGAMVVFVTNLLYDFHFLMPYSWYEQYDIAIDFAPPNGFEPMEFRLLDGDQYDELEWEKTGENQWRFHLPELKSSAAVLVLPEP